MDGGAITSHLSYLYIYLLPYSPFSLEIYDLYQSHLIITVLYRSRRSRFWRWRSLARPTAQRQPGRPQQPLQRRLWPRRPLPAPWTDGGRPARTGQWSPWPSGWSSFATCPGRSALARRRRLPLPLLLQRRVGSGRQQLAANEDAAAAHRTGADTGGN